MLSLSHLSELKSYFMKPSLIPRKHSPSHHLFIGSARQREPCRGLVSQTSSRNGLSTDGTAPIALAIFVSTHIDRCSLCRLRRSCVLFSFGYFGRGQSFCLYVAASPLSVSLIPCFSSFISVYILRVSLQAHRLILPRKVITSLRNVKVVHSVFVEKSS